MKILETKQKVLSVIRENICISAKGHTYVKVIPGYCITRPNGRKAITMDLGQTVQLHSGDSVIVFAEESHYQLKFVVRFAEEQIFFDEEVEILEEDYKKYVYKFSLENMYVSPQHFKKMTGACTSGIEEALKKHNMSSKMNVQSVRAFTKAYYPQWSEKFDAALKELSEKLKQNVMELSNDIN